MAQSLWRWHQGLHTAHRHPPPAPSSLNERQGASTRRTGMPFKRRLLCHTHQDIGAGLPTLAPEQSHEPQNNETSNTH